MLRICFAEVGGQALIVRDALEFDRKWHTFQGIGKIHADVAYFSSGLAQRSCAAHPFLRLNHWDCNTRDFGHANQHGALFNGQRIGQVLKYTWAADLIPAASFTKSHWFEIHGDDLFLV